jgi:hypothetical protein
MPHFEYDLQNKDLKAFDRFGKEIPCGSGVLDTQTSNSLQATEGRDGFVKIWKEAILPIGGTNKFLRASIRFDIYYGPMFDWVNIRFGQDTENSSAPAKLILLYIDVEGRPSALVHSVCWRSKSMIGQSTELSSQWAMEFLPSGWPALRKIDMSDIIDVVYVLEHIRHESSPLSNTGLGTWSNKNAT